MNCSPIDAEGTLRALESVGVTREQLLGGSGAAAVASRAVFARRCPGAADGQNARVLDRRCPDDLEHRAQRP